MRPRYGALGIVALPNIFVFQILFPVISPVLDLMAVVSLVGLGWQRYQHPLNPPTDSLQYAVLFYALFFVLDYFAALIAFALEWREDWGLILWLFLQRFFYRQLMYYVAVKSTLTALHGTVVSWGKLERKATVAAR